MDDILTVERVKKVAMTHYNSGGDVIIECWEDKEIQEWIDGTGGWNEPGTIQRLLKMFDLYEDRRKDIESTIF